MNLIPARAALMLTTAALLAACSSDPRDPAPVVYRGTDPATGTQTAAQTRTPDSRGVVQRDGFQTIRAREGDTVDSMAARVGVSGAQLAAYNGLSTQYQPKPGDDLVIPSRSETASAVTETAALPEPTETAALPEPVAPSAPAVAAPAPPPAETGTESGWSAELAREALAEPATPTTGATSESTLAPTPRPESVLATASAETAVETAPATAPAVTEAVKEASVATPKETGGRFLRPVAAPVARQFSRAPGSERNDGVDFATKPGDAVHAAGDGEVALISESLGGLGTIVLIRHDDRLLTVYGRIDGVTVKKGDTVSRGQRIARVANLADRRAEMHFEVREGADSVDPEKYF